MIDSTLDDDLLDRVLRGDGFAFEQLESSGQLPIAGRRVEWDSRETTAGRRIRVLHADPEAMPVMVQLVALRLDFRNEIPVFEEREILLAIEAGAKTQRFAHFTASVGDRRARLRGVSEHVVMRTPRAGKVLGSLAVALPYPGDRRGRKIAVRRFERVETAAMPDMPALQKGIGRVGIDWFCFYCGFVRHNGPLHWVGCLE
jgi:hypothetical protein